jgi:hypothetical protein
MTKGILSAGLVAALVLFVFATLQNYGPQSAVRRFHEAVRTGDPVEIEDSIVQPDRPTPQSRGELQRVLVEFFGGMPPGTTFSLRNYETIDPRTVDITAVYQNEHRSISAVWQVKKTPEGWKVDIHGTWQTWNQVFRLQG